MVQMAHISAGNASHISTQITQIAQIIRICQNHWIFGNYDHKLTTSTQKQNNQKCLKMKTRSSKKRRIFS